MQSITLRGIVERRLYDKDGNPLKMFKENSLWGVFKKVFDLDIKIPFLTGHWTTEAIRHNTIVPAALANVAGLINGVDTDVFKYLALGIGTATATGLESEIVTGGGEITEATVSLVTTTETDDTAQLVYEWTFSDSFAITEEGIFNASSSGDMLAYQNFSAVNVESGNKFEVTHKIVVQIPA